MPLKSLGRLAVIGVFYLCFGLTSHVWGIAQKDSTVVQKSLSAGCQQQRVHRVGNINFCITNWGFLGSQARSLNESEGGCFNPNPSEELPAPSFEFPKGSGLEYLFQGALWVGGVVEGKTLVTVGTDGWLLINEMSPATEDQGGCINEKSILSSTPNCNPPDMVGAVSEQDIIAIYSDTNTVGITPYPYDNRPHKPLGIQVLQNSYSWGKTGFDSIIILDYRIINIGLHNIDSAYVGFYYDGDVMYKDNGVGYLDDITGFKRFYVSPADETTKVDLAWLADNNGDPGYGVWTSHSVTGVTALKVLETPNPALKYSYNWWVSSDYDPANLDWGPVKQSNWNLWNTNYGTW
jgi:hypothetical protein